MTSCSEISNQLAALSAQIAELDNKYVLKSERQGIINESVGKADTTITPKINPIALGAAGLVVTQRLAPVTAKVAANAATAAAAKAAAAAALAQLAGLAAIIASILASIAGFRILAGRIDAIERGVSALGNQISEAFGRIQQVIAIARRAEGKADNAGNVANRADNTANQSLAKATNAEQIAQSARRQANSAKRTADETRAFVQPFPGRIDDAKRKADEANKKSDEALRAFPPIRDLSNSAKRTADEALQKAREALERAFRTPARGEPGKDGRPGRDGKPGTQGLRGIPGQPGRQGFPGFNGQPGRDGKNGKEGLRGLPGLPGRPGRDGQDGRDAMDAETKRLIRQTANNAFLIPALVARPIPLTAPQTEAASAAGTCKTAAPGGCMNKLVNDAANGVKSNSNNNTKNILDKINAGSNAAQLALLQKIDVKLGAQVLDGLSGNLARITKFIRGERITNFITMAATLHNAAMLSNALTTTLLSTVTNVFSIIGLRDADGQEYDASELIKTSLANFLKSVIGTQNYDKLTLTWKKASRVYQAGANVVSRVRSIVDAVSNIATVTHINVADIGNALRRDGVVDGDSYREMSRSPGTSKFQKAVDKLTNLTEAASDIESVTSSVRSIQDDIKEIRGEQEQFNKELALGMGRQLVSEGELEKATDPPKIEEKDLERA
ncbi:hypothetical protein [Nodularia sp. UHCC 0506]|uniref:hypothetical protein n=1 Tax=Nodularia sp. UHCC 0506 TaxID=3110243 RepID=UPI002B21FA64|nr:hypothetical protein [Nodularia sp. UHCC 0506]MEA5516207.1 hypothetical protein [Nodularia sp. UHCC 0506]